MNAINRLICSVLITISVLSTGGIARSEDYSLNLSSAANMGFKDETAGDGKGGWSDQGPEADMDGFNITRTNYAGIQFAVIDPAKNNGKAVVTFDNFHAKTGLKEITIDVSDSKKGDAPFLYLLHTSCWNSEELGSVIGTVRITFDDGTKLEKSIRSGVDVSDWWNASAGLNSLVVFRKPHGEVNLGLYLSKFALTTDRKEKAHVRSVTFRSTGKTVWILVGATLSSQNVDTSDSKVVYEANQEWKPVDMSNMQVAEGSALDLSSLVEPGPAGKHGRVIVAPNGSLAFEDSPNTTRRFFGFNTLAYTTWPDEDKESRQKRNAELARLIKRQGYNVVRLLVMEHYIMLGAQADCDIVPEKIDEVDYLIAELKANGIYTVMILSANRLGFAESPWGSKKADEYMARMYIGEEKIRQNWKMMAEKMLNHVNPYTKLSWKDDPAIVCWDLYNEQEWGMCRLNNLSPATRKLFDTKWQSWLLKKYKNIVALASAWGNEDIKKPGEFEKLTIPNGVGAFGENANSVNGSSDSAPVANDFGLFFRNLASEEMSWCEKVLREAGYTGLFAGFDISKEMLDSRVRWDHSPLVNIHTYFNHPSSPRDKPGSRCATIGSSAGNAAADYWRDACSTRLTGRPLLVTEFNHAFWNKYQHEAGLLFSAYSAFQDFSALVIFQDPVYPSITGDSRVTGALRNFSVAPSPVARAGEFISALLFKREDVKKASHRVELSIPDSFLNSDANGNLAVNTEQTKLSLMTGLSLSFPSAPKSASVRKINHAPDLTMQPAKGAKVIGVLLAAANTAASRVDEFPLQNFVSELKGKNILPASNLSDPSRGIFHSETGEIMMRTKENLISVVTPKSEGVSLEANVSETLGSLIVDGTSVPACIAVCSMDGNDLKGSRKIVLVYSTEVANSGMELSDDTFTLRKLGGLPILMRTGKLRISLKNIHAEKLSLYALGINGARKEKLSTIVENDVLKIKLDTSMLKNGPTPFFEISSE